MSNAKIPKTRSLPRIAGAAAALALVLSACGGGEEIVCTMEARASVIVQAFDPSGAEVEGVRVDYRIDGGAPLTVQCHSTLPCVLEWDIRGQFAMTVTRDGYQPATATVTVTGDECHVTTRTVNVTLQPVTG